MCLILEDEKLKDGIPFLYGNALGMAATNDKDIGCEESTIIGG